MASSEKCCLFFEIIISLFIPPIGVGLHFGCALEFWICLLLTLLGYLPGMIYAIYVLVTTQDQSRFL